MDEESRQGHGDLNSAIGAAQRFAEIISGVETDLEQQVATLEGEVSLLTAKNYGLEVAVDHLEDQLKKAKKDCYDPDSPEAMAGEVSAPPTKNEGTASGSGPF